MQHRLAPVRGLSPHVVQVLVRRVGDNFIFHLLAITVCVVRAGFDWQISNAQNSGIHGSSVMTLLDNFLRLHFVCDVLVAVALYLFFPMWGDRSGRRHNVGNGAVPAVKQCLLAESAEIESECASKEVTSKRYHQYGAPSAKVGTTSPYLVRMCADETILRSPLKEYSFQSDSRWRKFLLAAELAINITAVCVSLISCSRVLPLWAMRLLGYFINYHRLPNSLRTMVCSNKRIMDHDLKVLDISHITDRVVAMSYPAEGIYSLARNPIRPVANYLESTFPGGYLVVNVAAEISYNEDIFRSTAFYPCDDHEVMSIERLFLICEAIDTFLRSDPETGVAVHCLGGKGRTGLTVSCWLLYSGLCQDPLEAIAYYGLMRTEYPLLSGKLQTTTNNCQVRFVQYFARELRERREARKVAPVAPTLVMKGPNRLVLRLRRVVIAAASTNPGASDSQKNLCGSPSEAASRHFVRRLVVRVVPLLIPTKLRKASACEYPGWVRFQDLWRASMDLCSAKKGYKNNKAQLESSAASVGCAFERNSSSTSASATPVSGRYEPRWGRLDADVRHSNQNDEGITRDSRPWEAGAPLQFGVSTEVAGTTKISLCECLKGSGAVESPQHLPEPMVNSVDKVLELDEDSATSDRNGYSASPGIRNVSFHILDWQLPAMPPPATTTTGSTTSPYCNNARPHCNPAEWLTTLGKASDLAELLRNETGQLVFYHDTDRKIRWLSHRKATPRGCEAQRRSVALVEAEEVELRCAPNRYQRLDSNCSRGGTDISPVQLLSRRSQEGLEDDTVLAAPLHKLMKRCNRAATAAAPSEILLPGEFGFELALRKQTRPGFGAVAMTGDSSDWRANARLWLHAGMLDTPLASPRVLAKLIKTPDAVVAGWNDASLHAQKVMLLQGPETTTRKRLRPPASLLSRAATPAPPHSKLLQETAESSVTPVARLLSVAAAEENENSLETRRPGFHDSLGQSNAAGGLYPRTCISVRMASALGGSCLTTSRLPRPPVMTDALLVGLDVNDFDFKCPTVHKLAMQFNLSMCCVFEYVERS